MNWVKNGIDLLLSKGRIDPRLHWGLVSNDASITAQRELVRVALLRAGFSLQCLFTPEHGISARGADGAPQAHGMDGETGLPKVSLYGTSYTPDLSNLDGVIFDLPDIGTRFYTYIWTLSYLMETCWQAKKTLVILDRPNPLSGCLDLAEGPILEEDSWSSFIGRWAIPIRHSLTVAELANFWQHSRGMKTLDLQCVPCEGWPRTMFFRDTGLPFAAPSPAIRTPETIFTYPTIGFLEGLNLNEGRGTDLPFRQFGAPWLKPEKILSHPALTELTGIAFQAVSFVPEEGRYAGQPCHGIRLQPTNLSTFRPIKTGLVLLALLWLTHAPSVSLAPYPTWANPSGAGHLGRLLGSTKLLHLLQADPQKVLDQRSLFTSCENWSEQVKPFLLY